MKKITMKFAIVSLVLLMVVSSTQSPVVAAADDDWEISTGLDILVYVGDAYGEYASSADYFNTSYWAYGNNVNVTSDYDFENNTLTDWDAILMTNTISNFTQAEMDNMETFVEAGDRLFWVAGDSDFSEGYNSSAYGNVLLDNVQSNLRLDGGSISDAESNDYASYRVVANETGVSSTAVDYVTEGFSDMIFHGPTAVSFYNYTTMSYTDLRNRTIADDGIEIYINSSSAAVASDAGSLADYDYYPYASESGDYPMLASQMVNGSVVVASGEAIFSDYKEMYDWVYEQSGNPHDGIKITDRLLAYWLTDEGMNFALTTTETRTIKYVTETLTNTVTDTSTETTEATVTSTVSSVSTTTTTEEGAPFAAISVAIALFVTPIAIFRFRRRNE